MAKTLIVIGGSALQVPVLRWAKEAGLRVVLTDRRENAPGRAHADEFVPLSGSDVEGQVALARRLAERGPFAGAYCGNDFGLPAVAAVARATGVPGPAPAAVARSLDKALATDRWRERGIPTTEGVEVTDTTSAVAALQRFGGRAILKPVDSSGSRGVRTLREASEVEAALHAAARYSGRFVVERLLEGTHLDVNGFFRDGAFVPGGLLERVFDAHGTHIPTWGSQPARLDGAAEDRVYRLLEASARALGLDVGPVKADVVLTAEGPVIYELAPRFHGDVSTSWVTPLVYGKSPVQAWLAHLAEAGGPFDEMPLVPQRMAGWAALLAPHEGELDAIEGRERARRLPGIERIHARRPGFVVESTEDNRAVCGFVWATGSDRDELEQRLRSARRILQVKMSWQRVA